MNNYEESYGHQKSKKPKGDKNRKRTLSSSSSSSSEEHQSSPKSAKSSLWSNEATSARPSYGDSFGTTRNDYYQQGSTQQSGNYSQARNEHARYYESTQNQGNTRNDQHYQNSSRNDAGRYYNQSYSQYDGSYLSSSSSTNPRSSQLPSQGGLAPVVAQHYNQIEEKGLEAREESKIVILRKYNNWAKSMNFNDAMYEFRKEKRMQNSLIGLDLCCGKGGDLRKWEKSRMMQHVVFVDIAEVSLNNCRERYHDMKKKHDEQRQRRGGRGPPLFSAEFIVADCTKESVRSKLSNPDMQFDLVSCQFSFHYCFESYPQAQQMLRNATENLVPGGYFIGTLPNADRIVKRRRQCGEDEFGNEVYKIRFECEEPYPVYGARYFFELEDAISCPEFLVHFPSLVKLASSFDLTLIYRHAFDKFHRIHAERPDAKSLLNGMGALETYPASKGEALHFSPDNYKHAADFIENLKRENPNRNWNEFRVGTISAVEWEAIRLYLAFCFRKNLN